MIADLMPPQKANAHAGKGETIRTDLLKAGPAMRFGLETAEQGHGGKVGVWHFPAGWTGCQGAFL